MSKVSGNLRKMLVSYDENTHEVSYQLNLDNQAVLNLNQLVGQEITMSFSGSIYCIDTGKKIKKTYNQGYCYQSFISLARNDLCIMKPEQCHYHLGTCREPDWAKKHCFQPHTLYIASHSHMKVGITRSVQQITRWIDQGALWVQEIAQFDNRFSVGKAEYYLTKELNYKNRANWRSNLRGEVFNGDKKQFFEEIIDVLEDYDEDPFIYSDNSALNFVYPVQRYIKKPKSVKLDKTPYISQKLLGIRGQYLIFEDDLVLNIRSHAGYNISIEYEL